MPESQSVAAFYQRFYHLILPLAFCALAAFIRHPASLMLLLLAQPFFSAGIARILGYLEDEPVLITWLRRCTAMFALFVCYAALVALLVGVPLVALVRAGTPLNAFLLSGGIIVAVVSLWRIWPSFGLPILWDDAFPHQDEGSWIFGTLKRSLSYALHLTLSRDVFFARGLPVGILILILVAGAMTIAGVGSILPSELRISALFLYAGFVCPFAHFILLQRTVRLLHTLPHAIQTDDRLDPVTHAPAPLIAAIALAPLPSNTSSSLNAQLYQAVSGHQTELALSLLEHGADASAMPAIMDRDQRSLLMLAATHNDVGLVRALIARGAAVNHAVNGLTPLICATRDSHQGRADAVMALVANGADVHQADAEGNTPLHHAALSIEPAVAAILLDGGSALDNINREGLTPLGIAAGAGNIVLSKFLLDHRAKPQTERGISALIATCNGVNDQAAVVKLLIKAKADLHARDQLGRTALHAAALHGHAECVDLLLHAGANVDARDAHGVSALMEAARAGSNRVLQRLVFSKPEPAYLDHAGRSALVIASQSRQANKDTIQLLMTMGADPSQVTPDGRKAVDFAVAAGRWPMVAVIDPGYPLPLAHEDANDTGGLSVEQNASDPAQLRQQAARQGRSALLKGLFFGEALKPSEIGDLYLLAARALHGSESTCRELVKRGARFESMCSDWQTLAMNLLKQGQIPVLALQILNEHGAQASGHGLLGLLLEAATDPQQISALEKLALSWIEQGADIFGADVRGRTPLQISVQLGFESVVGELLSRGVDPNRVDVRGRTALHELANCPESSALSIARRLLRAGADPERRAADGHSALGHALAAGRPLLANALNFGGFAHPGRALRGSDLPAAATLGDLAAVQRLLELDLPIDSTDAQMCTALIRASGGGHLAIVELLLSSGAKTNLTASTGATALSASITARRENVFEALLKHGVDIEHDLPGEVTPLMVAAALGSSKMTARLLEAGAKVERMDDQGSTALHAAVQFAFQSTDFENAKNLLETLLQAGANINARNAQQQSVILLLLGARAEAATPSAQRRLAELLEILMKRRVELNGQDQRGVSALHACAMHGLTDCARLLLRGGAKIGLRDFRDRTALDVAQLLGYNDLVAELKRHGAG